MLDYPFLNSNIFNLVNVDAKKVLDSIQEDETAKSEETATGGGPKKRKRLEDFTPQERMIRRKLKNRAAAQSARDRKKERMDHLETVVSQLEIENKELKRSNEELRGSMHMLMTQNQQLLDHLRSKTTTATTTTTTTTILSDVPVLQPTGLKRKSLPDQLYTDHTYFAREPKKEDEESIVSSSDELYVQSIEEVVESNDDDDDDDDVVILGANQVVIKKEEETDTAKHASLGISLPQKLQILLVSLITMWLTNPRLSSYLTSLSVVDQEKVVKQMILRKVEPKLKQNNSKAIQTLLQTDLVPILRSYARKRKANYLSCVKKSKLLSTRRLRQM